MPVTARIRVAAVACATLSLALWAQSPATAAPSAADAGLVAVATPAALGTAAPDAVAGYWTPQRMAHAVPLGETPTAGPRTTFGPVDPWQSDTVGQLFFQNPSTGFDQRCSASTVASGSGRLVLTAARCLHTGAGGEFMRNVAFSPTRYHGGEPIPYAAAAALVHLEWANTANLRYDWAFVVLYDPLVHLIGGNHLMWNGGSGWQANSLAYTGYPFHNQFGCQVSARYVNVFTDRRLEVNCPTHDALAAGGPWLRNFDTNSRIGYINGVNGQRTSAGWHRSSYFTSEIFAVYEYGDRCRPDCP